MYLNLYHFGLLAVTVSSMFLAALVYLKAQEDKEKNVFLLVNMATVSWALCLYVFHMVSRLSGPDVLWLRLSHLAAIFVPVTFVHFVFVLTDGSHARFWQVRVFYLIALVLGLLSFTSFSIPGITYNEVMGYHIIPGPGYKIFSGLFLALTLYGFVLLIRALRYSTGFRRNQIKYFLFGAILGFGGAISTFLPLYGIHFPPVGILVVPGYGVLIAYAILRRRLMDIRSVMSKGLIYLLLSVVVLAAFSFLGLRIARSYHIGPEAASQQQLYLYVIGFCLITILVLMPLRSRLERVMERILFRRSRASSDRLARGSRELLSILDRSTLVEYFLQTIIEATGVLWGVLWLRSERDQTFHLADTAGRREERDWELEGSCLNDFPVLTHLLQREARLLTREEVFPLLRGLGAQLDRLHDSKFTLMAPLILHESLRGCIFVGEKASGELFSPHELQTLTLFTDQAAIAFENAQLFQQVRRMKEYNERIMNNIDSGLVALDEKGRVTIFNRKAEALTGLPADEVVGEPIDVLPGPLGEIINDCLERKKPISIPEFALRLDVGPPVVVGVSTTLMDEGGEGRGIVMILVDLTEVKQLEGRIQQTEKMASIGSMLSQLAHEIKNPLSSIRTFAELLPEKFQDEEFRDTFFSLVLDEINRIDGLINRMLNFGRADANLFRLLNVGEMIEAVASSLRLQCERQDVALDLHLDRDAPVVWANAESLREAFTNVLVNSLQAMPNGGRLEITLCSRTSERQEDEHLEVVITDEGGGIRAEDLNKIFEPFFSTKSQGSGLGLYICYQAIRRHQGDISVVNTDTGTRFVITLPVANDSAHGLTGGARRMHG